MKEKGEERYKRGEVQIKREDDGWIEGREKKDGDKDEERGGRRGKDVD